MSDGTKLAVVNRVAAMGTAERKRLAEKGREAIATVVAMRREVEQAFYAMGEALSVLSDSAVIRALGHPSFAQLCDVELGVSVAQATRLIHIVESFGKREAARLTSTKATAIIDLAGALGNKTTAKGLWKRRTVHLPDGTTIDVESASAAKIANAAKALRARKPGKKFGVHVTPADRQAVAHAAAALRRAKIHARVEAIAASAATGAKIRITFSVRDLASVGRVLASK